MKKGYKIIKDAIYLPSLDKIPNDMVGIEVIAQFCKEEDVFRTENGAIKQIQNLHKMAPFNAVGRWVQNNLGYVGEIINMQYFIKHPNYKITAPHQDGAYFDNTEDDILTFWIPLHVVNEQTSTMFYVDWDGKREILPHKAIGTNKRTRTGKTGFSQYTDVYPLEDFKPVELEYGDCVVHNQFAIHYSNENKTDKPRIALTCIIKLNKMKIGDRVAKNAETWEPNDFDDWGRGTGVGYIMDPPFEMEDGWVDVKWPTGRCFEQIKHLKLIK